MRPQYEKRKPEEPRGAGNSPMEKSFVAAAGYAKSVLVIISNLKGAVYNPPDENISITAMTELAALMEKLNKEVSKHLDPYGDANRERKEAYDGTEGMSKRITAIKSYLASFKGGKTHSHYIEFTQAIKGN